MRFPNKVNRYKSTVIYQMVQVINALDAEMKPASLFVRLSKRMGAKDFYEALSCLYALGKVEFNEKGELRKC